MAPEPAFPGALEDNHAALKGVYDNAAALGIDPAHIALLGESAGGGHAAMLAIAARDWGAVPVAFQALVYPMLDERTGSTRSVPPHIGRLLWTPQLNAFGWTCLLGPPVGVAVELAADPRSAWWLCGACSRTAWARSLTTKPKSRPPAWHTARSELPPWKWMRWR